MTNPLILVRQLDASSTLRPTLQKLRPRRLRRKEERDRIRLAKVQQKSA